MKPRHMHLPADCRAISDVLARVGDKWSVLVVTRLGPGPMRFNELRRSIGGISQRMLTLTLRGLERDGLDHAHGVSRPFRRGSTMRSPRSAAICWTPVSALGEWATRNQTKIARAREQFDGVGANTASACGPESELRLDSLPIRIYIVYPDWSHCMKSQIAQWGNSVAVRLPKSACEDLRFAPGSEVEMSAIEGTSLRIRPAPRRAIPQLPAWRTLAELKSRQVQNDPETVDWGSELVRNIEDAYSPENDAGRHTEARQSIPTQQCSAMPETRPCSRRRRHRWVDFDPVGARAGGRSACVVLPDGYHGNALRALSVQSLRI